MPSQSSQVLRKFHSSIDSQRISTQMLDLDLVDVGCTVCEKAKVQRIWIRLPAPPINYNVCTCAWYKSPLQSKDPVHVRIMQLQCYEVCQPFHSYSVCVHWKISLLIEWYANRNVYLHFFEATISDFVSEVLFPLNIMNKKKIVTR